MLESVAINIVNIREKRRQVFTHWKRLVTSLGGGLTHRTQTQIVNRRDVVEPATHVATLSRRGASQHFVITNTRGKNYRLIYWQAKTGKQRIDDLWGGEERTCRRLLITSRRRI